MLTTGTDVCEEEMRPHTSSVPRTVWLVDDDDTLRSLLADSLPQFAKLEVTQTFNSIGALLEGLEAHTQPDVLVLDVNIGCDNGVESLPQIMAVLDEKTAVTMLTTCFDSILEDKALACGASAFLLKTQPLAVIAEKVFNLQPAERPAFQPAGAMQTESRPEPQTTWAARLVHSFQGRFLRLKRA